MNADPLVARQFGRLSGEDGYHLTWTDRAVRLEVRHLRRDRHELIGELTAICEWVGAKTVQGSLSTADFNLTSDTARKSRSVTLSERSETKPGEFDWRGFLEEFCVQVIKAERLGAPALRLDDAPDLGPDEEYTLLGLQIPLSDPTFIQADGGSLKSMLALYLAGCMAQSGRNVLYFDSEWTDSRHKQRKIRLFGQTPIPGLIYLRGERPLTADVNRVRRVCEEFKIRYLFLDSVLPFLDGPPEDADVAQRYFRALRQIGLGSCTLAHISHSSANDSSPMPAKAFGSRFFHQLARRSWMLRKQQEDDASTVIVGAYPDKRNDGPRGAALGIGFTFEASSIRVSRASLEAATDLSERLPLRQRIQDVVSRGAKSYDAIATELGAEVDAVRMAVNRNKSTFTKVTGADGSVQVGLLSRSFHVVKPTS